MATLDKEIQILMLKGQKGDTGRSIESIVKTSSVGDTDTYTITYTDGTTTTFQVENGISQQELETALAPVNSNISSLQQGKVNINWQSEEYIDENNSISNNPNGIQLSSNATDQEATQLIQPHRILLEVDSYNNTEEQLDYETKLTITDTDITVSRNLGSGSVDTASLFDLIGIADLKNKFNIVEVPVTTDGYITRAYIYQSNQQVDYGNGLYEVIIQYSAHSGGNQIQTSMLISVDKGYNWASLYDSRCVYLFDTNDRELFLSYYPNYCYFYIDSSQAKILRVRRIMKY